MRRAHGELGVEAPPVVYRGQTDEWARPHPPFLPAPVSDEIMGGSIHRHTTTDHSAQGSEVRVALNSIWAARPLQSGHRHKEGR